jgi:hypothetical protein
MVVAVGRTIATTVMPTYYTSEQVKQRFVAEMGEPLGGLYYHLWSEVIELHSLWHEFVELYGKKPERVDLLNQAASSFFSLAQNLMWQETILQITRLTDSPQKGKQRRLTLRALSRLVNEPLRDAIEATLQDLGRKAAFCRDWRDRHIAHRDFALATEPQAEPLKLLIS